MNDLKPCHCNTTPILQRTRETGYYIHCPGCKSFTHGVQWSREEALAVWNNRPDETGITDWKLHKAMADFRLDIMEKQAARITALEAEKENLIQALELSEVSQKEMADSFKETNAWQEIGRLTEELAALESKNAKLRDPWVRIDPERPESLPPSGDTVFVSCVNPAFEKPEVHLVFRIDAGWLRLDWKPLMMEPYAWQPWPEPAVYEDETP